MAVILISSASYYYCISGDFLLQAADFTILDVVHISFHFDGVYQLYNLYQYTTSTTVPDLNTTHPNPTKGALFLSSTLLVKLLITQKRDTVQCVQWKLKRSWHSNICFDSRVSACVCICVLHKRKLTAFCFTHIRRFLFCFQPHPFFSHTINISNDQTLNLDIIGRRWRRSLQADRSTDRTIVSCCIFYIYIFLYIIIV